MRPIAVPSTILEHYKENDILQKRIPEINSRFSKLIRLEPEVSIVIPAYNEEKNILKVLSSLSYTNCKKKIEVIVINNNSKDETESLALATGVICLKETRQGIEHARNAGLAVAKGKYVLNADADTIYPPDWIDEMINPLINDNNISLTYGTFSFIPTGTTGRVVYFFYEHFADFSRILNKKLKDESVNVYGFSSAFRREQGILVDGFNFPTGAGEDGWFALKLRDSQFGRLQFVTKKNALVWTTDRRVQFDGGLWKGLIKRIRRIVKRA